MTNDPTADEMTRWSRAVHVVIRAIVRSLCRVLFRLEIRNSHRLPMAGAYIIAPVHRSNIDAFIAVSALPARVIVRTVAKDSLWQASWLGRFLEKMGSVPVDRERPDRAAMRRCEEALAHGEPLLMFPEGARKQGSVVDEVLEGPAWLSLRKRVPIVPMGIAGTERAMPKGARFIRPTKVIVEIGEPIIPDRPADRRVRQADVVELSSLVRSGLQQEFDKARRG